MLSQNTSKLNYIHMGRILNKRKRMIFQVYNLVIRHVRNNYYILNALKFNGVVWVNILVTGTEVVRFQALLNSKNVHLNSDITVIHRMQMYSETHPLLTQTYGINFYS